MDTDSSSSDSALLRRGPAFFGQAEECVSYEFRAVYRPRNGLLTRTVPYRRSSAKSSERISVKP